ncbi:UDP-N-acetylmuramoyl-L-alanine--D-glutamate ligase [Rhizobacter sp. Root1221]|uniref:Mur ligase family protein n=1 Tax=Rhizobacter sp. Root1221 TaxID=1736433 RepID=UPI0006FB0D78|nr:Mur ligase family protein [Rhizobacter sp. Root1221]KQW02519.1 UDP-N-acetylmuramoylalanine--D-glutamate ligase [Rhizobacter sp. Root1221]
MKYLKDISVLVLGLGDSGLAMARWCARFGASVTVWDSRDNPPHAAALAEQVPGARRLGGAFDDQSLIGVQMVFKSPGLAPIDPRIAPLLAQARATGVPVQGELDLFAAALADLKATRQYAPKVIAITGTNGKTTTTSMTAQLIERTGLRVAVAGNIGPTMLDTLAAALDLEPAPEEAAVAPEAPAEAEVAEPVETLDDPEVLADLAALDGESPDVEDAAEPAPAVVAEEAEAEVSGGGPPSHLIPPPPPGPVFAHLPEVWVLELSSFQLDGVKGFEPSAATVLNVTQDHLDWHGSMDAYAAAKARAFGSTAVMVINRDDPLVLAMVPKPVPGKGRFAKPIERDVVRFGLDAPQRPGDYGLLTQNGITWLVRALVSDEPAMRRKRGAAVEEEELVIQRLMPADALRVRGRHNAANALAALALATSVGCPIAPMLHGLREYGGEPHRVEYILSIDGIEAYDDSKGTNVGATVAALTGLGADKAPSRLVVILGGDGKGQDFSPLMAPVQRFARAVATIGRDAEAIEAAIAESGVTVQRHDTLQAATRWAFERAHQGDSVLLSPACASLDMFRNYAHRAEVFVAEVQAIAADRGGMSA